MCALSKVLYLLAHAAKQPSVKKTRPWELEAVVCVATEIAVAQESVEITAEDLVAWFLQFSSLLAIIGLLLLLDLLFAEPVLLVI